MTGSNLECGFINDVLFCYDSRNSTLYSLSMHQSRSLSDLDQQWQLSDTPNESRIYSNMIPLADADSLMLYGGIGLENQELMNQTKIYHVDSGKWKKMSNYVNPRSNMNRQIMMASAAYVPKLGAVVFYGGQEITPMAASNQSNTRGFDLITLYNLGTNIWSLFSSQANIYSATSYPVSQTATFFPSKGSIVYLGGALASNEAILGLIPLSYGMMFNTNNGVWTNRTFGGKTPSPRISYSATLLPNGDQILIYGGSSRVNDSLSVVVSDFCYTLNLSSMNWTEHTELYSTNSLAPRSNHSAVLIETTIFILFGLGSDNQDASHMLAIDVQDPTMLAFIDHYTSNKSKLSTGAIVGIVIGCVVALAILIVLMAIFYMKRRRSKKKEGELDMQISRFKEDKIEVERSSTRPPSYSRMSVIANEEDYALAASATNSAFTLQQNKETNTHL
ncbi:Rab9 effector protein with kelch motifs [Choanephora cucurbitarum]|uniref:Rab9 effector protein with kelch motifs n=1 Tax=Choanephora cucurbitarum TaxID=101091 RepID=A0A1C7NBV1_9FUNG|nr:Rab9 effector protein with kelch motifs [Choanephora cucurbitarum]